MNQLTRGALLAAAMTPLLLASAAAQDNPRVSGTITRDRMPMETRVQVLTNRRARLGVVVRMEASPTDTIGAVIDGVTPNGPAARAGIRSGDIILRFNGTQVADRAGQPARRNESVPGIRLVELAARLAPGDTAILQYRRGKVQQNTTVIAGDEPAVWSLTTQGRTYSGQGPVLETQPGQGPSFSYQIFTDSLNLRGDSLFRVPMTGRIRTPMPRFFMLASPLADLELAPINPELGRYFGTPEGVLVIDVPEGSRLGLKPGDVVLSIDGRDTQFPGQLLRALESYEPTEGFSLVIMRQKGRMTVTGSVAR